MTKFTSSQRVLLYRFRSQRTQKYIWRQERAHFSAACGLVRKGVAVIVDSSLKGPKDPDRWIEIRLRDDEPTLEGLLRL